MNEKQNVLELVSADHIYGELLAALYQGGIQPKPWDDFLKLLRIRTESDVASIVFRSGGQGLRPAPLWNSRVQLSPSQITQYKQAEASFFGPLIEALLSSEGVLRLDQVVHDLLESSPVHQQVTKPYGLEYAIGIRAGEVDGITIFLGLVRGPDKANFDEEAEAMLLQLKKHLQSAVQLHSLKQKQEAGKQIYSDMLNSLTIATVILDGRGKVLEVNEAAKAIMKRNSCIAISDGCLVPEKSRFRVEFNNMLKTALNHWERRDPEHFVDALRLESTDADLGVLIRTAPHFGWYQTENVPNVIVHLDDFQDCQSAPEKIIARLFRLTRSEARLTACLAQGLTLTEAAVRLGVTESSARTYSKKIFGKVGVSRQADLVRLVLKSVALLARKPASQ